MKSLYISVFLIFLFSSCQDPESENSRSCQHIVDEPQGFVPDYAFGPSYHIPYADTLTKPLKKNEQKEETKASPEYASMRALKRNLATRNQTFILPSLLDTHIVGKGGTKIFFPYKALVQKDGVRPEGKVKVKLKECYSMYEMVKNHWGTRTKEGKMLESRGMIAISATSKGEELRVDPDKELLVAFPKKGREERGDRFDLYVSSMTNKEQVKWEYEKESMFEFSRDVYFGRLYRDINGNPYYELYTDKIQDQLQPIRKRMGKALEIFRHTLGPEEQVNFNVGIQLNSAGKISAYRIYEKGKEAYPALAKEVEKVIEDFNIPIPLLNEIGYRKRYKGQLMKFKAEMRVNSKLKPKEINNLLAGKQEEVTTKNYYMFSTPQLGLINCDDFPENSGPMMAQEIKTPKKGATTVCMIFPSLNSMMVGYTHSGGSVSFSLPKELRRTIVVINLKNGQPHFSISSQEGNPKSFAPQVKRGSKEELLSALKGLGSNERKVGEEL